MIMMDLYSLIKGLPYVSDHFDLAFGSQPDAFHTQDTFPNLVICISICLTNFVELFTIPLKLLVDDTLTQIIVGVCNDFHIATRLQLCLKRLKAIKREWEKGSYLMQKSSVFRPNPTASIVSTL